MIFDITHKRMIVAIEQFIATKKPNTKRAYELVWSMWRDFLGKKKLNKVDVVDCAKFIEVISRREGQKGRFDGNRKASPSTITHRLVIINGFYDLALNIGIVKGNPFAHSCFDYLRKPQFTKRPTEMLSFDKVMTLINSPCAHDKEGIRDRAILALLFGGALRRSEIVNLRMADVKKHEDGAYSLFLRQTKNNETQAQYLAPWVNSYLEALIVQRKSEGASDFCFLMTDYYSLFNTSSKKPLDSNTVYRVLKRYAVSCGLGEHITPHSARATAITRLLELGVPHREVRKFSRHASTQSVEIYDKRRQEPAKKVAKVLNY